MVKVVFKCVQVQVEMDVPVLAAVAAVVMSSSSILNRSSSTLVRPRRPDSAIVRSQTVGFDSILRMPARLEVWLRGSVEVEVPVPVKSSSQSGRSTTSGYWRSGRKAPQALLPYTSSVHASRIGPCMPPSAEVTCKYLLLLYTLGDAIAEYTVGSVDVDVQPG